jgi:hypothetical protein
MRDETKKAIDFIISEIGEEGLVILVEKYQKDNITKTLVRRITKTTEKPKSNGKPIW